jgi:putative FmdB family regulatory protein
MPLYEYTCRECGESFERRRRFDERLAAAPCPRCGTEAEITLSMPGLVGAGSRSLSDTPPAPPSGGCCGGGACGF